MGTPATARLFNDLEEMCHHNSKAPVDILESLPESQAGLGRHKCVACAYKAGLRKGRDVGYKEGYAAFKQSIIGAITKL